MSCCPKSPEFNPASSNLQDTPLQETEIRQGESVECYARRVGNTTGLLDDATDNALDKIENTSIPINCSAQVDVTFRLTAGSTTTPTSWRLKNNGVVVNNIFSVVFTPSTGRFAGTFATPAHGQSFNITIEALNGAVVIDTRGYTFSPTLCSGQTAIQFLSPLPGAQVNSKFGPRMHPIYNIMKMHNGIDMRFADRSVADVVAAADGVVTFAGSSGGAGNMVKLQHRNGSGVAMCTTVYCHLAKIYVAVGQNVAAGQKIGLEGTTGASTGNHLHFGCILPNGTYVDPEPYIRGSLAVARKTLPTGEADQTSIETRTSTAAVTREDVTAKENGCEPFGPSYPPDPTETTVTPPVAPPTDPFETAWLFTMRAEIGPSWTTTSPSDAEIAAGLIATRAQQQKVGYVNLPNFPGGETKFGVAQGPNPSVAVRTINYAESKQFGFNNYWKKGCEAIAATQPKTATMMFDMNYLHGVGNVQEYIRPNANITGLPDAIAALALHNAQVAFIERICTVPHRAKFRNGWLNRSRALLAYAQSL